MKNFKLSATIFLSILFLFVFSTNLAFAHPGRTASDGCHYCRTNCDSWGVAWNARHCHGGYTAPPSYSSPSKSYNSCPSNSTYSSSESSCICNTGYALSLNLKYCVKIPKNAHAVNNKTDVWLCDDGYKEINNSCVKKESCENNGQEVLISRVIDGDTVEFNCDGNKEKIRIIGIDTPETVHPSKPVECFGKEASKKIKELVLNKKAILKKGQGTSNRGKYGRLLRYIEINNEDIGSKMIKDGFAFSYRKYPHERLDEYNKLEREARENETGLWAKGVCDYNEDQVDDTPNVNNSNDNVKNKVAPAEKESTEEKTNLTNTTNEERSFFERIINFFKWLFN